MQIFFLNEYLTVLIFIVLWFVFQLSAALLCLKIPDCFFNYNSFLFRERKWEKGGEIYEKLFKVRKWKGYLPDGGAVTKNGYRKKNFKDHTKKGYEKFIVESCRAELVHLLSIFPFWVFGFFAPFYVVPIMFIYALAVNIPCIITQRFNRPRFIKIMNSNRILHY